MMTDDDEPIIIPTLTGFNWPSYILQAYLSLRGLGIADEQMRFIPKPTHITAPEICAQEPPPPAYDERRGKLTVHPVKRGDARPRLSVSVRKDILRNIAYDGGTPVVSKKVVGRLAHFFEPMMAGIPGHVEEKDEHGRDKISDLGMDRLARHIGECFPELMQTPPVALIEITAGALEAAACALGLDEPERARYINETIDQLKTGKRDGAPNRSLDEFPNIILEDMSLDPKVRAACGDVFRDATQAATAYYEMSLGAERNQRNIGPVAEAWEAVLFSIADPEPAIRRRFEMLTQDEARLEAKILGEILEAIYWNTPLQRQAVVREIAEIITTIAFITTAAIDARHGMRWIHGRIDDIRLPLSESRLGGLLMASTGGWDTRSLQGTLMRKWTRTGNWLGIGTPEDSLTDAFDLLDDAEQDELWALVAWRRTTPDPIASLEIALRRFLHTETAVEWSRYRPVQTRLGSLLAQPGSTAMLGGDGGILYPGVVIYLPVAEDTDERSKPVLELIINLFVPVGMRVQVVWEEAVARLGHSYLQHDFQTRLRFADSAAAWAAND